MTKMWGVKAYRRYILWEKSKDSRKHGSHRKYRLARNYRVLGSGARCTGAAVEIPVSVVSNGADKYNGAIDKSESRCSILTALGFSWLLFTPPPPSLYRHTFLPLYAFTTAKATRRFQFYMAEVAALALTSTMTLSPRVGRTPEFPIFSLVTSRYTSFCHQTS